MAFFLGAKRPAIHCLYTSCRKFLGENLEECSIEELHNLEVKLAKSLHVIRGKKVSSCQTSHINPSL
jgi:hypothetical protein